MKVQSISYRRVYNLGNYESEALEIEAQLGDGEKTADVLPKLRDWCEKNRTTVEAAPPKREVPAIPQAGAAHLKSVMAAAERAGIKAEVTHVKKI